MNKLKQHGAWFTILGGAVIALVILWISSGWWLFNAGFRQVGGSGDVGFFLEPGTVSLEYFKFRGGEFGYSPYGGILPYDPPNLPPLAEAADPFKDPFRPRPTFLHVFCGRFRFMGERNGFLLNVPFWFLTGIAAVTGSVCWMVIQHREKSRNS